VGICVRSHSDSLQQSACGQTMTAVWLWSQSGSSLLVVTQWQQSGCYQTVTAVWLWSHSDSILVLFTQ